MATFRSYREGELPLLTRVAQESLRADGVDYTVVESELEPFFLARERWIPGRDTVVAEVDGEVVGWAGPGAYREDASGRPFLFHWGCLRPEWRRRGIGTAMLHRLQDRLRPLLDDNRLEAGSFATHLDGRQTATRALVEADGYRWTRGDYEMVRSLADPIDELPVPDGIALRRPEPHECRQVIEATREAFEDLPFRHAGDAASRDAEIERELHDWSYQPEVWVVAWAGGEVVGSVRGWIDATENAQFDRRRGYTERISVRRPWRNRGIASAMIAQHLRLLQGAGMNESALSVDTENPSGALPLYERLGFRRASEGAIYSKEAGR